MFLRIWCLYACKLALVCMVLILVGYFMPDAGPWKSVSIVATAILIPVVITGALAAVWACVLRKPVACPSCGTPAKAVMRSQYDIGVECDACGLVHANVLTGLRLKVEPLAIEQENEEREETAAEEPQEPS